MMMCGLIIKNKTKGVQKPFLLPVLFEISVDMRRVRIRNLFVLLTPAVNPERDRDE